MLRGPGFAHRPPLPVQNRSRVLHQAGPRNCSLGVRGPSVRTGTDPFVSHKETLAYSSTDASGPASAASASDAAPGASAGRCSCTQPRCWPGSFAATRPPPDDTILASCRPTSRREVAVSSKRRGRNLLALSEPTSSAVAVATTRDAPRRRAISGAATADPTGYAAGPGT